MSYTRRTFLQGTSLLAAALPLAGLKLRAAEGAAVTLRTEPPARGVLREVLFSPGNITERKNGYDRYEPLKKSAQNPVMTGEMSWEKGGVNWGSVIRSQGDGKFKFFYCTDFPGAQEGAVQVDNSMQGKNHCVVCYAESDDGLTWRRPALNLYLLIGSWILRGLGREGVSKNIGGRGGEGGRAHDAVGGRLEGRHNGEHGDEECDGDEDLDDHGVLGWA